MHWIVQDTLYSEENSHVLLETLERFDTSHTVVSITNGVMSPDINPEGHVFICGTYQLASIAQEKNWTPGSFLNENHQHEVWMTHWGNHMLNADAITCQFRKVVPFSTKVFIRPCEDNKFFNGQILEADEVTQWRDDMLTGLKPSVRCSERFSLDTLVTYGPEKKIYQETRFFVIDGKVVTGSMYRKGGEVCLGSYDTETSEFAQKMVDIWQPARGFVLDIALTAEGYRIVEVNCLNMAGFYLSDVQKLVMTIENLELET